MFNIFGNSNSSETVRWQSEPTTRGSFGILSTCLITISLCIWTALHLNVPGQSEKSSVQFWRKVKWLAVGLFAPEIVLFTAWYQYGHARETANMVSRKLSDYSGRSSSEEDRSREDAIELQEMQDPELGSSETKVLKFTTKQGFFLNMGGLAFDVRAARGIYIPTDADPYWIVNSEGLFGLCEWHPEIFDTVTERCVADKSKTGNFGKTIVCLQALWFIAQCISRLAQSLPISLLELNTFGHCICALLVYCFWWNKPLDIEQPVSIQADNYRVMLAWMWMCSLPAGNIAEVEWDHVSFTSTKPDEPRSATEHTQGNNVGQIAENTSADTTQLPILQQITLEQGQQLPGTVLRYSYVGDGFPPPSLQLSKSDVLRWELVSRFLSHKSRYKVLYGPLITRRISNFLVPEDLTTSNKWLAWSTLLFTSIIYGGLHALAWDIKFGSHAEQVLWRVSAVAVMGYGFVAAISVWLLDFKYTSRTDRRSRRIFGVSNPSWVDKASLTFVSGQQRLSEILHTKRYLYSKIFIIRWSSLLATRLGLTVYYFFFLLAFPVMFFGTLLYLGARVYLVVECFISLFRAPPGLFQQPVWASYFPHIG